MRRSAPREVMALSAAQRACKDRILTQPHPARIGNTVDAVVLKHGRLFMLADDTGDVPWRGPHGYGLFDGDTRVLDGFVLELDGQAPTLLSVTDARDGTRCTTVLAFSPAPDRLTGRRAEFVCALAAGERREIGISITPCVEREQHREPGRPGTPPTRVRRWLERLDQLWLARAAEVRSSNPLFDRVMLRALLDLRLLRASLHGRQFFCAGVPWFSTLFGRDAATVAIQTLPFGSATAGHTLRLLARYQANAIDAYRDAEPGKILHELRTGELARLGAIPQSPAYYGPVDATRLFLHL